MKLLLDACVWGGSRNELEGSGHDVEWAGDWPEDPKVSKHGYSREMERI